MHVHACVCVEGVGWVFWDVMDWESAFILSLLNRAVFTCLKYFCVFGCERRDYFESLKRLC